MTEKATLETQNLQDETSLSHMLRLATPAIISTISFSLMQFVDRYMVACLGTDALAAILPAQFVSFVPASFAMGTITILNTFVSQSFGRGAKKDCSSYFWQAAYIGFAYFVLVLMIMWPAAPLIFRVMGQPESVVELEVVYFRIMLYALILVNISHAGSQFFMGIHRPIINMYASLLGQVINIVANYLLIYGKFGFPAMGIAGAGWGTVIGLSFSTVVSLAVFLGNNIHTNFQSRRTLKIDFGKMYNLLKIGVPAGLGLMVNVAIWGVILTGLVGMINGKEALAATSVALSYASFVTMPIVGIATALTAAVGKSIGQGKKNLAVKQTSICMRVALIYMGLVGICFFLFRDTLISFWSADDKVKEIGVNILICAAIYLVFHAARIIYSGSLQGAGDTIWIAIISAAASIVVLGLGGVLIVICFPSLGALGPWIAATMSVIVNGLANRWRFKSNNWMKIDLFKRQAFGVPLDV